MTAFLLVLAGLQGLPATADTATARVERQAWALGTRVRIEVESGSRDAALRAAESALQAIEQSGRVLSTWDPASEMSRVNAAPVAATIHVSPGLAAVLSEAAALGTATAGHFDPAVGPLVDAWDLRGEGREPTPQEIAAALARTGPDAFRIRVAPPTVERVVEGAWIDTGGFGKGAALREAARVLSGPEVTSALVDLGGQLWIRPADGEAATVAVAHPRRRGEPIARLRVSGASVATSGTSERWVLVAGERHGHILDPRTGRPAPPWGSVTVVSPDPLEADVLATALYAMGPERGMAWALDHPEVGVLFVRDQGPAPVLDWNPTLEPMLHSTRQGDR